MNGRVPVAKELVLVGGGHSHVAVLKRFGMAPVPGVRLTLVSDVPATVYSGMLPGCIAGHYRREEAQVELRPLCHFAGAQFYVDAVTGLDLEGKRLLFAARPPASFDLLSINIGSTPQLAAVPGAAQYALPVKPVDRFLQSWETLARTGALADPGKPRQVVVVGGGAGGVELLLAVRHRLLTAAKATATPAGSLPSPACEFHLVTATSTILSSHNRSVQRRYQQILQERGVHVHNSHRVMEVRPQELLCERGRKIAYDVLLWATNAVAPAWLRKCGLAVDADGFVKVNACLQSLSHPFVFAAGDIAAVMDQPRPKSGVFAVRQGRPLADNLRRALAGQPLRPFTMQRQFLSLISTGDRYAVASRGPFACQGKWVWRLKDWIDRRWVRGYQELPPMHGERSARRGADSHSKALSDSGESSAARCGGCGAKVGHEMLQRVLSRLKPIQREDVLLGLQSPDDAAVLRVAPGMVSVQTVDFFRSFLNDPFRFGQVAANHCLGDILAMGAEPQSALIIATVPYGAEARMEEQLHQALAGVLQVLNAHQTQLAGGHTAEGSELALGLVVNGLADPDQLWRKRGLQPGQVLLLVKPLGTGTLFAADMRGQARGSWIEAALRSMLTSNQAAAQILRRYHASACTDVTGFGLLGHLTEMLQASEVSAALHLDQLPVLEGAITTAAQGWLSSLHPQNLRRRNVLENESAVAGHERFPLLFDPQTAGGLLAGLAPEEAEACRDDLHRAGYAQAAIIGRVTARVTRSTVVAIRDSNPAPLPSKK